MRTSRTVPALLLAVAAVLGAAACSSEDEAAPSDGTGGYESVGERVFDLSCKSCHGPGGKGGYGPQLSEGKVVEAYPDLEDHLAVIRDGKGGTMPPWEGKLTEEEIRAVAEYERSL